VIGLPLSERGGFQHKVMERGVVDFRRGGEEGDSGKKMAVAYTMGRLNGP